MPGRHELTVGRILTDDELYDQGIEVPPNSHILTAEQVEASRLLLLGRGVLDETVELP